MTGYVRFRIVAALLALSLSIPGFSEIQVGNADEWNFDVYIDDKKVGTHSFSVSRDGVQQRVESNADFKLKLFFVPAYSYLHSNTERWSDNCLLEFNAMTRINGKQTQVSGTSSGGGFTVQNNTERQLLPGCVMTFAYWNPEFLKQERLLNPQTGEFMDVNVESLGKDALQVHGEPVIAQRYKLTGRNIELLLWYSTDEQWLRLESVAKTGHVIRYELS